MTNQQVGEEIFARCPSCKKDTNHTIAAIEEDRVGKVFCTVCKKEHTHYDPREDKSVKKKKTVRRSSKKTVSPAEEWEKAMEQIKDLAAKPYSLAGRFETGEKLDHGTFGLGLIKNVNAANKMEVVFKEGTKLLVWGRS